MIDKAEYDRITNLLENAHFTFARSMPKNPHFYTLRKTWEHDDDFVKAVQIIRSCGYVTIFWKKPYITFDLGDYTYWTMGNPINPTEDSGGTTLINRKVKDHDGCFNRRMI